MLQEEIDLVDFKIQICEDRINYANEIVKEEEMAEMTSQKRIIFAKTSSGNTYYQKDIKDIPDEYVAQALRDLRQLRTGITEDNEEKAKSFKNNNRLKGIHELKSFKVRTIYRIIDRNTIQVLMVRMKKSDNDRKDLIEVITRADKTMKEFNNILDRINDQQYMKSLIDESEELYETIVGKLEVRAK